MDLRSVTRVVGGRLSGTAPRLYERAADVLADRIRAGALPPGEHVTETMVAVQLGISRPPARRALIELELRGLVERSRGRGFLILPGEGRRTRPAWRPANGEECVPLLSLPSWERIYSEVEDEIIARISFADWRLNEAKLARHFRVSRTVARDVVGRLQQRGLLRKDDSSRWYAPALTPEHICELHELRTILEPVALIKAAARVSPEFVCKMRKNLEDALAGVGDSAAATLERLEEEMHVGLLGYCGNRAVMQALTLPQSLLTAHRFLFRWIPCLFVNEPCFREHLEIVLRLQDGDARAAAAKLEVHLGLARDRAIARVEQVRREFSAEDLPYLARV